MVRVVVMVVLMLEEEMPQVPNLVEMVILLQVEVVEQVQVVAVVQI
tara:strand:- start:32 stop:169 length:138 start_codon:yes stop_codon:yes gene_type:complete